MTLFSNAAKGRLRCAWGIMGLALILFATAAAQAQTPAHKASPNDQSATVGDAPADPGPLAVGLSPKLEPQAVETAMRKVADWQVARVADQPSLDWTFATLYAGLLAAGSELHEPRYDKAVQNVAEYYDWQLGSRVAHADDHAIGQAYLALYRKQPEPVRIAAIQSRFDALMKLPDDPAKPVWWWCDALFMAPPVWSGLAAATHDPRYLDYMDREWQITSKLLWDPEEKLFYRDATYFSKREKNGRKVFWSRGNGWVMGGLVRVLETMPQDDPRRPFYVERLRAMASKIVKLQGKDGLWRPGLLDEDAYPLPEISGSAFFVYAMAWGVNHHVLDAATYGPAVAAGWAGLLQHIYADGRLGSTQPVGAAPGAFTASASYVFGVGAFLCAGTEVHRMAVAHAVTPTRSLNIVFCGDSITWGAGVHNTGTTLSPTLAYFAMQALAAMPGVAAVYGSNQGHNGHTTTDWLPSRGDYQKARDAMMALAHEHPDAVQVFSMRLGTNDSASSGTNNGTYKGGLPADVFAANVQAITAQILRDFPHAVVVWNEASYYSPNTHNGAIYDQPGLDRLYGYRAATEAAVAKFAAAAPHQVFVGDTTAFAYFKAHYQDELRPEPGVEGTFYLHPLGWKGADGKIGTQTLGEMDAAGIAHALGLEQP